METDDKNFDDAIYFLEECFRKRIKVYGVERVIIECNKTYADLDGIFEITEPELNYDFESILKIIQMIRDMYGNDERERFFVVHD